MTTVPRGTVVTECLSSLNVLLAATSLLSSSSDGLGVLTSTGEHSVTTVPRGTVVTVTTGVQAIGCYASGLSISLIE